MDALLDARHHTSAALLRDTRDLQDDRLDDTAAPALDARGWRDYLLGLADDDVAALECGASWSTRAPPSLVEFGRAIDAVCDLPPLAPPATTTLVSTLPTLSTVGAGHAARRHEKPAKQAQIDAFAALALPLARGARRVVDVGSGHGHLTRQLAARLPTGTPVVGLERNAALVAEARALAGDRVTFATVDIGDADDGDESNNDSDDGDSDDDLAIVAGDLVTGLHACGALGDTVVRAVGRVGASLALIGCCLQKRRAPARAPLTVGGEPLRRDVLGLSNLSLRDVGKEASRAANLQARQHRLALRRLLQDAGVVVDFGAEIQGLNRRLAHGGLQLLVERAFARRSLPPPSPAAVHDAEHQAREQHAQQRRLQLPRTRLARLLEVHVALDRAVHLQQHGLAVEVGTAFSSTVSPRNLLVLARPLGTVNG